MGHPRSSSFSLENQEGVQQHSIPFTHHLTDEIFLFHIHWKGDWKGETDLHSHFNRDFRFPPSHRQARAIPHPWSLSPTLAAVCGVDDFHTEPHSVLGLDILWVPLGVSFPRYDSATLLHGCTALHLHSPGITPTPQMLQMELQHLTPVLDCSFQAYGHGSLD